MSIQSVTPVPTSLSSSFSLNLPPDPKNWSSTHVAAYLHQCLQLHPPSLINELLQFVQSDTSLTGRRFLRLKDDQLRNSGYDAQWIEFIMVGVKSLRREQLKEKILLKDDGKFKELEEGSGDEDDFSPSLSNPNSNTCFNDNSTEKCPKAFEFEFSKETNNTSSFSSLTTMFSLNPVNWILSRNNASEWLENEISGCETYKSGFTWGFVLGGAIVWACIKVTKR
ncbi:9317_t:CDS:2 [Acaulospora morrowiae]|uniref:9317_t:CDS:1 n=1 Tax=Acaulospora morrowiae TaxID=94023 RepID=A0A9N9I7B0_9GLOM|nr:9317_t:CDS:2 [Acaulospora morrowiae]